MSLHLLVCTASKHSTYQGTVQDYMDELAQSHAELATLGQVRWATSGRLPWHIEAVCMTAELVTA